MIPKEFVSALLESFIHDVETCKTSQAYKEKKMALHDLLENAEFEFGILCRRLDTDSAMERGEIAEGVLFLQTVAAMALSMLEESDL